MSGKKKCHIFLVRHGQTEWNVLERVQGHQDSPLTDLGREQAEKVAEELSNIKFDAIYSSDSGRCVQTAQTIAKVPQSKIILDENLRESFFGPFEGKSVEHFIQTFISKINYRDSLPDHEQMGYQLHPEVESPKSTGDRVLSAINTIAKNNLGKTVLVATHAGSMRSFLIQSGLTTPSKLPFGTIANSSYIELDSDGQTFEIIKMSGVEML